MQVNALHREGQRKAAQQQKCDGVGVTAGGLAHWHDAERGQ